MAKAKKGAKRRIGLAAFFRRLWKQPALLERFSQSVEGRQEVIGQFNLAPAHRRLLVRGCMRDIIRELAGAKATREITSVINCTDEVECKHPECKSFMSAVQSLKPLGGRTRRK